MIFWAYYRKWVVFILLSNFVSLRYMQKSTAIASTENSKGAYIFKKMLEDKKAIHEHLSKGGKIEDLKDRFKFVKPLRPSGK